MWHCVFWLDMCLRGSHACADINYLDYVWRIIIGFGALPAVATIYLRSTLPETPRYTTDVSTTNTLSHLSL